MSCSVKRARPFVLVALLVACRATPLRERASEPSTGAAAPSARDGAPSVTDAAHAEAAQPPRAGASAAAPASPPSEPRVDESSFGGRWVALGVDLVDASTGSPARKLPPGRPTFSADGEHLAVVSRAAITLARASTADDDFAAPLLTNGDDDASVLLADDGRSAVVAAGDALLVIDAVKRKATTLVSTDAGAWEAWRTSRRMLAHEGRRVTWTAGGSAFARDLDSEKTIAWTATGGRAATSSAIAGDVAAALFDDELVAVRVPTGEELVRKRGVSDYVVGEGGRTIAWMDAQSSSTTVVLFDVAKKRETASVGLADDPNLPAAKQRFRGVCGGGPFRLDSLKDAAVTLRRDCSLLDILYIRLDGHASSRMESHTPAEDYEDEQRFARACKRAKVAACDAVKYFWAARGKRFVMRVDGKLVVFDTASGRRVADLERSEATTDGANLAVAPNGKTMAGIDGNGVGRLWDLATGKPLFESKQ